MAFQSKVHPTLGPTVKQRIMLALDEKLAAMQIDGVDVWHKVYHGDLDDIGNESAPCAAIDFGEEEMLNNTFPCSTYRLPVYIQWKFRGQRGLDEHDVYLYYLGIVQLAMLGEHNLGPAPGYSYDVRELSNAHTIIGVEDASPGGFLNIEIHYKTRTHNPYNLPFEA